MSPEPYESHNLSLKHPSQELFGSDWTKVLHYVHYVHIPYLYVATHAFI